MMETLEKLGCQVMGEPFQGSYNRDQLVMTLARIQAGVTQATLTGDSPGASLANKGQSLALSEPAQPCPTQWEAVGELSCANSSLVLFSHKMELPRYNHTMIRYIAFVWKEEFDGASGWRLCRWVLKVTYPTNMPAAEQKLIHDHLNSLQGLLGLAERFLP